MKAKNFTTCPVAPSAQIASARIQTTSTAFPPEAASGRAAAASAKSLSQLHIPSRPNVATVELFKGAGYMAVNLAPCDAFTVKPCPEKRGEITHFTNASRRRMLDLLAKVLNASLPFWMDLTYPDSFPTSPTRWKWDLEVLGVVLGSRMKFPVNLAQPFAVASNSPPQLAVQGTILNRLGNVVAGNHFQPGQIRNRTRDF